MTLEHTDPSEAQESPADSGDGKAVSRRDFLRLGTTTAPIVLTLHSGAALARSSNLISAAPDGTRQDGAAMCLDTSTATPLLDSYKFDLGDPAYATVNLLPEENFYPSKDKSGVPVSADQFCREGNTRYYQNSGWNEVSLPKNGIIVSATALNSVSTRGDIYFNKIF